MDYDTSALVDGGYAIGGGELSNREILIINSKSGGSIIDILKAIENDIYEGGITKDDETKTDEKEEEKELVKISEEEPELIEEEKDDDLIENEPEDDEIIIEEPEIEQLKKKKHKKKVQFNTTEENKEKKIEDEEKKIEDEEKKEKEIKNKEKKEEEIEDEEKKSEDDKKSTVEPDEIITAKIPLKDDNIEKVSTTTKKDKTEDINTLKADLDSLLLKLQKSEKNLDL